MDWSWSPTLYYGLQPKSSPDGQEKFSTSGFRVRALYHYTDALDLHVGLGVLSYKIAGSGGLVTQNNGSGSSTFATPLDSKTTSRYTLDLGSAYAAGDWRFDLSILVTGPFTTSKLALNPLFTVSMGFL